MVRPHCNCDKIAIVNKLNENNIERWTLEVKNISSSQVSRRIVSAVVQIKEITIPSLPIVRSDNLCKTRGPCVLSADVVSLLISSFKLLAHTSSLVSWGFWLFVPYSGVIPCHGGIQPPFTKHTRSVSLWKGQDTDRLILKSQNDDLSLGWYYILDVPVP